MTKIADITTVLPAQSLSTRNWRLQLPVNLRLYSTLLLLSVVLFSLLRIGLIAVVRTPGDATWGELSRAFLTGFRFDLVTASYMLVPIIALSYLPFLSPWRTVKAAKRFVWLVTSILAIATLLLGAEVEFFQEFQTRYNQLAIRYLDQPATVGGMVWYNYPIIRYLLVWLLASAAIYFCVRFIVRRFHAAAEHTFATSPGSASAVRELAGGVVIFFAIVFGVRGGVQGEPIRWGDAFKGDNEFVSQMSLNGLWSLGHAVRETFSRGETSSGWSNHLPHDEARRLARQLVVAPDEKLIDPEGRTVLRQGNGGSAVVLKAADGRPLNVVVVMMESFSARFVGATGAPRSVTPAFDALTKDGLLFDRCFSAGSHTHQGIFATQLGFPNLPGYETLMESGAGNQEFLSLPAIFQNRGYQTFFLYNGNFSWDNMRGFFRKQGVNRFVGGEEMLVDAKFRDPVWGVSDGDLFDRCNREFEAAHKKGQPFFAAVMTLSNHAPFQVPPVPGLPPITDMGALNPRLTAMQYADWAIGHFITEAKKLSYFDHTLFVFVGDHGFAVKPTLTEVNLLYHHVPLLFYAPGLMDRRGVDHRVASHMNVVPSVVGLLGLHDAPQVGWGRSLFNDSFTDENFAVFKMSGGGQAVALARGDDLLVLRDAKATPQMLKYTLWPPAVSKASDDGAYAREKQMTRELKAYVQSALSDLAGHRAGPVESQVK